MSKYLKYKTSKKPNAISALQHHLFDKLGQIENDSYAGRDYSDPLFQEFAEHGYANTNQLLHKAKNIVNLGLLQTYNNRGKLERIKRQIKKCQEEEKGAFVTGVGLYLQEKEVPTEENLDVDEDSLMRNLAHNEFDDLAELRRMIKKTESNLRNYSQSVYNIQNEVMNAADKIGREIDVGLAIKINRCGLQRTFYNQPKPKHQTASELLKKRAQSSQNPRRKQI